MRCVISKEESVSRLDNPRGHHAILQHERYHVSRLSNKADALKYHISNYKHNNYRRAS